MKVSFLPENIIKYIPTITKVIPTHSQVPILSNILLSADKNGFVIQATDLDMGVKIKIPSKIEEEGEVTVPGKEFLETLSSLPKDKVLLEKEKENLILTCAGNRIVFNTISPGEFPQLIKDKGEVVATFKNEEFLEIFSNLTFSVSQEESRPQLTGVYLNPGGSMVDFVSTDGYRMSIKKKEGKNIKTKEGLIISVKIVNEVLAVKGEDEVTIYVNSKENQVVFEVGEALFVGRMISGKFPDYEGVLPTKSSVTAEFDRDELLQSVRLVSVFAKDNSNIINLSVENGQIMVDANTQGVGRGEAGVACTQKGGDVKIAFNIRYLLDVLKFSGGKNLTLKLNSPADPALFESKESDFLHVIMPIQVDS